MLFSLGKASLSTITKGILSFASLKAAIAPAGPEPIMQTWVNIIKTKIKKDGVLSAELIMNYGLWIMDYGLWIMDYGFEINPATRNQ